MEILAVIVVQQSGADFLRNEFDGMPQIDLETAQRIKFVNKTCTRGEAAIKKSKSNTPQPSTGRKGRGGCG